MISDCYQLKLSVSKEMTTFSNISICQFCFGVKNSRKTTAYTVLSIRSALNVQIYHNPWNSFRIPYHFNNPNPNPNPNHNP